MDNYSSTIFLMPIYIYMIHLRMRACTHTCIWAHGRFDFVSFSNSSIKECCGVIGFSPQMMVCLSFSSPSNVFPADHWMQYYNSFFQQSGALGYVQKPAVRTHPQTRHPREQTLNVVGSNKKS